MQTLSSYLDSKQLYLSLLKEEILLLDIWYLLTFITTIDRYIVILNVSATQKHYL